MGKKLKVAIASKNPVKVDAVAQGFGSFFNELETASLSVESGVPDQPMSDSETRQGAINRVVNARTAHPDFDFWVGIEGGVHRDASGLTAFAWVVILNQSHLGEARTTSFRLPEKVRKLIDEGYELGDANDRIFGQHNSKQNSGAVGLLTRDVVTRTQLYRQAVEMALIPFINTELYASSGD